MALAWENNWKRVISFTLNALFNGSIVFVMNAMILDEILFHTNFGYCAVFQCIPIVATRARKQQP
jgi:hypothetical protein